MTRFAPLAVLAALFAGLLLLRGPDPAEVAALRAGELLEQTDAGERLAPVSELLLRQAPDGRLALGEVRVSATDGLPDAAAPRHPADPALRRSVIASLRETAAGLGDLDALVAGDGGPVAGGVDLTLVASDGWDAPGTWQLVVELPDRVLRPSAPWVPPSRSSLLPPLIAIALAIVLRKPVIALAIGVLAGTFLAGTREGASVLAAAATAPVDFVHPYFTTELLSEARYQIIGFVVAMLAMIGVLSRSGGIQGLMDHVARLATTVKRTQVVTWILGLLVFFDDYTNTILCGATMRPLTDRFRISREKLSYLVDSTAAPVAGLMIVSTWIAFEVSTFQNQLPAAGLLSTDGYTVFLETLPYRFYCLLTLFFVGLVVLSGRDFGPMLTAERRARTKGQLLRPGGQPMVAEEGTAMETAPGVTPAAWRALVPLAAFLGVTVYQILNTGGAFDGTVEDVLSVQGLKDVLGNASSSLALLQGSTLGLVLAVGIALVTGLGGETFRAAWTTLRSM